MLAAHSKDMRLAVWLAEAHAKTRGLRGLGDGYAVLTGLCEHYWDGLYPLADDGDHDQRIGNLFWLLNRTPVLVREMLFEGGLAPDQIARWVPGGLFTLGTDGFGRSDTREALRRHFEVDAEHVVVATLRVAPVAQSGSGGGRYHRDRTASARN